MMNWKKSHRGRERRPAFTLIELVLAILILAVVVGAIQGTLQMGLTAYKTGQTDMELYQSARIGLNRVADQLRSALSPTAFWRPGDRIEMEMSWEQANELLRYGNAVEEEDPGKIQFVGSAKEVTFARKVFGGTSDKNFDIQEVRLYVKSDREQIRMKILRSLLDIKVASWYFAYLYKTRLNGQIIIDRNNVAHRIRQISSPDEPPLMEFIGDTGVDGRSFPIAYGIKGIRFSYFDGENWGKSWNSSEIISIPLTPLSRGQPEELDQGPEFLRQEKGLPAAVSVTLTLKNGDHLETRVDIPAGSLNQLGTRGIPRNESRVARPGGRRPPPPRMYRRILRRRI